jgi:hypothetical protein
LEEEKHTKFQRLRLKKSIRQKVDVRELLSQVFVDFKKTEMKKQIQRRGRMLAAFIHIALIPAGQRRSEENFNLKEQKPTAPIANSQ